MPRWHHLPAGRTERALLWSETELLRPGDLIDINERAEELWTGFAQALDQLWASLSDAFEHVRVEPTFASRLGYLHLMPVELPNGASLASQANSVSASGDLLRGGFAEKL